MPRSEGGTALLDIDGFVVGTQVDGDGDLLLLVEKTADIEGCEAYGTPAVGQARRQVQVRALPIGNRRVALVWAQPAVAVSGPQWRGQVW